MYQRKKRNKWGIGIFALVTALLIITGSIVFYAYSNQRTLQAYGQSVANLPEVEQVYAVSQFSGESDYIVARVRLIDGQEYVYFIQDNTVVEQVAAAELMPAEQAMEQVFGTTDIVRYSLGRFQDQPIYELVANTAQGINYVLVNALTGEPLLSFVID